MASAELYDPSTDTFTPTGSMHTARSGHTATLSADGKVLVAGGGCNKGGGFCNAGSFLDNLSSAELYNPKTGTWSVTGSMHFERQYFTATLLDERGRPGRRRILELRRRLLLRQPPGRALRPGDGDLDRHRLHARGAGAVHRDAAAER